jgi:hypothetical protein
MLVADQVNDQRRPEAIRDAFVAQQQMHIE